MQLALENKRNTAKKNTFLWIIVCSFFLFVILLLGGGYNSNKVKAKDYGIALSSKSGITVKNENALHNASGMELYMTGTSPYIHFLVGLEDGGLTWGCLKGEVFIAGTSKGQLSMDAGYTGFYLYINIQSSGTSSCYKDGNTAVCDFTYSDVLDKEITIWFSYGSFCGWNNGGKYKFKFKDSKAPASFSTSFVKADSSSASTTSYTTGSWTNKKYVKASLSASDISPITYYYSTSSSPTKESSNVYTSWTKLSKSYQEFTTDGTYTRTYAACDNAKNCSFSSTYTIKKDSTVPTVGTFTLKGSGALNGYTRTKIVNYSVSASDTNISKFEIYDESGNLLVTKSSISSGTSYSGSFTIKDEYYFETYTVKAYDLAGNVASKDLDLYYLDPPSINNMDSFRLKGNDTAICNGDGDCYTNTTSLTYSIGVSGIGLYQYNIKEGSTVKIATTTFLESYHPSIGISGTLTISSTTGAHTLTLTVTDKAGNSVSQSFTIIYDTTAPTVSATQDNSGYSKTKKVTITASDSTSGVLYGLIKYYISNSSSGYGSKQTAAVEEKIVNALLEVCEVHEGSLSCTHTYDDTAYNGSYYLFYTATLFDKAGNSVVTNNTSYKTEFYQTRYVCASGYTLVENECRKQSKGQEGLTCSKLAYPVSYDSTTGLCYELIVGGSGEYCPIGYLWVLNGTVSECVESKGDNDVASCPPTYLDKDGNIVDGLTLVYKNGKWVEEGTTITYRYSVEKQECQELEHNSDGGISCPKGYRLRYGMCIEDNLGGGGVQPYPGNPILPTSMNLGMALDTHSTGTTSVLIETHYFTKSSITIKFDNEAPKISSFTLKGNSSAVCNKSGDCYTNTRSVTYTVSATDNSNSTLYVYIKEGSTTLVNGVSFTAGNTKTGTLTINSGDGNHILTVTITDASGNSATGVTYTIILDTIAPTVKILQSSDKKTWTDAVWTKERYLKVVATDTNLKDGEFKYYLTSLSNGYGDKEVTSSSDLNKYLLTCMLTNGECIIPEKITSDNNYIFIGEIKDKAGNSYQGDSYTRFYTSSSVSYCDKYYCINDVPADVYCEYNPDDFEHCIHGILKEEYCSMIGNDSHCIDGLTREEYCSSYNYLELGCIDGYTTEEYCELNNRYDERCDSYFFESSAYYDPTNLCPVGYIYIEYSDNICFAVSKGVKDLYCPMGYYNVLTGLCQDYIPDDFIEYANMDLSNYYCPEGYPLVAMEGINIYCLNDSESHYGQGGSAGYEPILVQDIIVLNDKFQLSYLGELNTISGDIADSLICPNFGIRNEDGGCVLVSLAVPSNYDGKYMPTCEYDGYFIYDYDTGLCHYYAREADESSLEIYCPKRYGYAIFMGDRLLCADYTVGKGLIGYLNYFEPNFDETPITNSEYYYDILCDRLVSNHQIPRDEFTFKLRNGGLLYKGDYIEVSIGLYEGDYNGVPRHSPYCETGKFNALTGLCELNEMTDIGFGPINNVACPNYFIPMLYNDYILYCGKGADIGNTELRYILEGVPIRFDFLQDLDSAAVLFYTMYYGESDVINIVEALGRAFDTQGKIALLGIRSEYSYYPIIPEAYNSMERHIYSLNSVFDGYSVGYDNAPKDMYYTGPIYGQGLGGTTSEKKYLYSGYFGKYKSEFDTKAPTINTFTITGNSGAQSGYTNTTNVSYTVKATDDHIYQYKIMEGSTTRVSSTTLTSGKDVTGTLAINSGDGEKTLTLTVYDEAGNEASKTFIITLDTATPTINTFTLTGNSGAQAGFTNTTENVSYTVKATDTNIYQYKIVEGSTSRVGATALTSATNKTGTLSISGDKGPKTLTLTVTDKAGNSATKTTSITLITPDQVSITINVFTLIGTNSGAQTGFTNTTSVSYTVKVTDTYIYQFSIKEGSTSRVGATTLTSGVSKTGTLTISGGEGTKTLTLIVTDKAGNSVSTTANIILDTTKMKLCINPSSDCTNSVTTIPNSNITVGVKESYVDVKSLNMRIYPSADLLSEDNLTGDKINKWNNYEGIKEFNFNSLLNVGKYYLYVAIPTSVKDKAGNGVEGVIFTVGSYNVLRLEITNNENGTRSSLTITDEQIKALNNSQKEVIYNISYRSNIMNSIITITVNSLSTTSVNNSLSTLLSKTLVDKTTLVDGLYAITGKPINGSIKYDNVFVKNSDGRYELVTLVIIDNTPRVTGSANAGSTMEVVKGEEIGNLGMSFTSVDGARLESETIITLNGVRVKRVDTSLLGEYEIRQLAKDNKGRSKEIITRIIVKDDNKEVVKEVEIPDIINNEVKVVVPNRVDNEVKVENKKIEINNYEVEMIVNSEVKEKKYRKRKEERGNKEEKLEFKLFSKYFFKVYDG